MFIIPLTDLAPNGISTTYHGNKINNSHETSPIFCMAQHLLFKNFIIIFMQKRLNFKSHAKKQKIYMVTMCEFSKTSSIKHWQRSLIYKYRIFFLFKAVWANDQLYCLIVVLWYYKYKKKPKVNDLFKKIYKSSLLHVFLVCILIQLCPSWFVYGRKV